jgi:pyruvate/2-oxoglutarate dehydrogenase complex dihydrolipoamide acyltransferase (E2) component
MVRREEDTMTKHVTIAISGALFFAAFMARAADNKAPAPAAATPAAKPAAAPAPATPPPAAAAPAAAAAPMAPPKPDPQVDALFKGWEGNWKCDTTFAANSMGPGAPEMKVKSEVKIKKQPGGFWYKGDYSIKKSKAMPGMNGTFLFGYDPGLKAPVTINYDDMGGYATGTAAGATADKLQFTGEGHMAGMKMKTRETMTKKSDKEIEHVYEMDMGKGFQPMGTDVCKK